MQKIDYFPASTALVDFIQSICPIDAHIHVAMRGVWVDGDPASFHHQSVSRDTTRLQIVREFSCKGTTYWTLERWEHDNGYRCTLTVLSKDEFLATINS